MEDARAKELYERVPYPSRPQAYIHPEPLAVISTLFGGRPAPVEGSRILEIGCADGSNLIAIAHYLPKTHVVGIDISEEAIARGLKTVKALGLENIEMHAVDLRKYDPGEPFDYVLCHGLWSWVESDVRAMILETIRKVLSDNGAALISYNTWPGWHTLRPARDIMRLVAEQTAGDAEQLVRSGLEFINAATPAIADSYPVYGGMLAHAAYTMEGHSESYLFHDFLAPVNEPTYFRDFVGTLAPHGLQYLGEAHFGNMMPYGLPGDLEDRVEALAPDLVALGQVLDFLRNTAFRVSVVCRSECRLVRTLDRRSLQGLHLRLLGQRAESQDDPDGVVWETSEGSRITAADRLTQAVIELLSDQGESSLPADALFDAFPRGEGIDDATLDDGISARLFRMHAAGLIGVSTRPYPLGALSGGPPETTALARYQLETRADGVSTATHIHVELDRFEHALLTRCDGTRSLEMLVDDVVELVRSQVLEVSIGDAPAEDPALVRQVVEALVPAKLEQLARLGLVR